MPSFCVRGALTFETFRTPFVTDCRNPRIAAAMWQLGYVQRFGVGIEMARRELTANGNPQAKFRLEPTYVAVTVGSAHGF
jgi:ATP-dependent DNA helicase RecG